MINKQEVKEAIELLSMDAMSLRGKELHEYLEKRVISEKVLLALAEQARELLELIDGVTELVEISDAKSPAQKQWKEEWLDKAKRKIAQGVEE
jgi:hypothetical protein